MLVFVRVGVVHSACYVVIEDWLEQLADVDELVVVSLGNGLASRPLSPATTAYVPCRAPSPFHRSSTNWHTHVSRIDITVVSNHYLCLCVPVTLTPSLHLIFLLCLSILLFVYLLA